MFTNVALAARALRKSPGFSLTAIVIIALGIGASTTIFTIINAALLRPLPGVSQPSDLVLLQRVQDGQQLGNFGYPDYLDYRSDNHTLSGVAATGRASLSYLHSDLTERIPGAVVSGNYFSVLGATPAAGRLLQMDDETPQADAAVISYKLWQRDFAGSASAVGQTIQLNGRSFTIVGVAQQNFSGITIGAWVDVWLPITAQPAALPYMSADTLLNRATGWITLFGRLSKGAQIAQAQSELSAIAARLGETYPATNAHRTLRLYSGLGMDPDTKDQLSRFLGLLLGAVVLLMLIACGNVSSLLLARGVSRRREIAIRLALGAPRRRLVTQLLTEALLLATAASALGLVVAAYAAKFVVQWQPGNFGLQNLDISIDARVFVFAAVAALFTATQCALAPIWQASKIDLVPALKQGSPGSGRQTTAFRSALVVGQVTLSMVLLIGAGLVIRTMHHVLNSDQGFETSRILLLSLDVTTSGYTTERGTSFYDQLLRRIQAVPGVAAASLAGTVPPSDYSGRRAIFYPGQQPADIQGHEFDTGNYRVDSNTVGPGYLRTMGVALLRGRDFTPQDRAGSTPVAIVNQRLAEHMWPGQNAIGQHIAVPEFSGIEDPNVEVIGIASDAKYQSLLAPTEPVIYLPVMQRYGGRTTLVVRSSGDPVTLIAQVAHEVQSLDRTVPLYNIETMSEHIATSLWQQQVASGLIGLFGAIATILAAVGLYGIIAQGVAERTREIGIRRALGAQNGDIRRMVLRHGFGLILTGIALGAASALVLTRFLSTLLYQVSPHDTATFVSVTALFCVVALLASEIPARRAARMNPIRALRQD